jgi:heme exporter protein CcmD
MTSRGLSEFLAMGGYAFYVWTSYVIAAVAIAVEIFTVRTRLRAAMRSMSGADHAITLHDDTQ